MTLLSKLGFKPKKRSRLSSECLTSIKDITIIVPVKDNQQGIDVLLRSFFDTHHDSILPAEIIIVDNNSSRPLEVSNDYPIPVRVMPCTKKGPASARNSGAASARTQWLLFTDSDCVATRSLLTGYLAAQNGSIGYAGNVKAFADDAYSKYYESQEILVPPKVLENSVDPKPDYLITANCLVWKPAFDRVGGFNESIDIAGGEDIDLGFRLREIGEISYAFESVVRHRFENNLSNFRERFRRYGRGNRMVAGLYNLDLTPSLFVPNKPSVRNYLLAVVQFLSLREGYRERK